MTFYNQSALYLLNSTSYTNNDSRCIYEADTNLKVLELCKTLPTTSIFTDYKNKLMYEGEAVLLEKLRTINRPFTSDVDVLEDLENNISSIVNIYEDNGYLYDFVKQINSKTAYFNSLIDENHNNYNHTITLLLQKIKKKYKQVKKKKLSQKQTYEEMFKFLNNFKRKELEKTHKSKIAHIFFKEFTNLQILYSVIKSANGDYLTPLYCLEQWRVLFVPQNHYTVSSFNEFKLVNNLQVKDDFSFIKKFNRKKARHILFNTPFITNRYIRKIYDDGGQMQDILLNKEDDYE